jgi:hypothetical protein
MTIETQRWRLNLNKGSRLVELEQFGFLHDATILSIDSGSGPYCLTVNFGNIYQTDEASVEKYFPDAIVSVEFSGIDRRLQETFTPLVGSLVSELREADGNFVLETTFGTASFAADSVTITSKGLE